MDAVQVPDLPTHDFNVFLHELRTRELRRMPPGAEQFLSGGCSGTWYFEWINDNYPGIRRHIGVEAYSPKPEGLSANVEWIPNYLGDIRDVRTGEVELVFAGQTVEHMWPDDLAAFLCETHRVLAAGGWVVLDSPNRLITTRLGWHQPQHTAELTVDEIVAMVRAAGFGEVRVRGVWLCYDREGHRLLPLDPAQPVDGLDYKRRVALGAARPEDCFVWWLEARRADRPPRLEEVRRLAHRAYQEAFPLAVDRVFHLIGRVEGEGRNRWVRTEAGQAGAAVYGPYLPLRPGGYAVGFALGLPQGVDLAGLTGDPVVAHLGVTADCGNEMIADRPVALSELKYGGLSDFTVPFRAANTLFGVEFPVLVTGVAPVVVRTRRDLADHREWVRALTK